MPDEGLQKAKKPRKFELVARHCGFQQHPKALIICDENATLELRVKTYKYFKDLWSVHEKLTHSN